MLTVVCWKWGDAYTAEHVNVFARMLARNMSIPHKLYCITDDSTGIAECETLPLWDLWANVPHPKPDQVTCYRRLPIFGEIGQNIGHRILSLDIDCVILKDLAPLVTGQYAEHPFVGWFASRPVTDKRPIYYCGSMQLFTPNHELVRPIFETFDPLLSPATTYEQKFVGSDQAWIGYVLGPHQPVWSKNDGVLSYKCDGLSGPIQPPEHTRIVFFHGKPKPWNTAPSRKTWVKEHWR